MQRWKTDPSFHSCETEEVDGQIKKKLDYHSDYVNFFFLDSDEIRDWESIDRCKDLWKWAMGGLDDPDISKWYVLDCGTKDCQFPAWLKDKVEYAVGVEISDPYVEYALSRNRTIEKGDVCNLTFSDNSFDFTFAHHLLGLTPDFKKGLSEMYRVLKPGGYMVTLDSIPGNKRKHYSYVDSMDVIKEWLKDEDFQSHEILFFDRNPYNKDLEGEVILFLRKGNE